ncbi:hypothetical protein [Paludisphaera borealis]|uniref:hypothetical protein n=1 Tax=Paludisphaera borealis TaxID=1387353 RepID=UPI0028527CC2|nr:hypothetical protein [Paludisphaera borealis]
MAFRKRIGSGLLLTVLAVSGGCGVQDSDQPAVGSISIEASRDDDAPSLAPRKIKSKTTTSSVDGK